VLRAGSRFSPSRFAGGRGAEASRLASRDP